jgi:hypothetical protein
VPLKIVAVRQSMPVWHLVRLCRVSAENSGGRPPRTIDSITHTQLPLCCCCPALQPVGGGVHGSMLRSSFLSTTATQPRAASVNLAPRTGVCVCRKRYSVNRQPKPLDCCALLHWLLMQQQAFSCTNVRAGSCICLQGDLLHSPPLYCHHRGMHRGARWDYRPGHHCHPQVGRQYVRVVVQLQVRCNTEYSAVIWSVRVNSAAA